MLCMAHSGDHLWTSANSHPRNALSSQPNVLLSEKRLHDLQNITRRAQVGASQGLDQLTKQFAAKALRIEEQQRCLIAIRRDVENHWAAQKAAANRVSSKYKPRLRWLRADFSKDDAGKPGNKPAAVQARPPGQNQDPNARHGQPAMRPVTQNPVPQPMPPVQAPAQTSKSSTPKVFRPAQPHAASYSGPVTHTTNIMNVGMHAAAYSATNVAQPVQPRPSPAPAAYSTTNVSQPVQPRPSPAPVPCAVPPSVKNSGPKRKQVAPSTLGGNKKPAAPASHQPVSQSQQGPVSQPKQTSKPAQKAAPQAKQKPGNSQAQGHSSSRSGGGHQQNQSGGNVTYVTDNTPQYTSNQRLVDSQSGSDWPSREATK